MKRFTGAALLCAIAAWPGPRASADEREAKSVIDKAIKALGGEEKLAGIKAFSVSGRGTVVLDGQDAPLTFETTAQGVERYRSSFSVEIGGNKFDGVLVLDGDKGWWKFDKEAEALDGEELANERRNAYIEVVPILLLPLKDKKFQVDSEGEQKVNGVAAAVVKATGPDGKEFRLYFDKESGLPIKLSARVKDFEGQEFDQDTTFEDYQAFDGVKVATKSKSKKDGERYVEVEGMVFKALDRTAPDTFAEPK